MGIKQRINKYTGDLDGFDDSALDTNLSSLENRVTQNETDISNLDTRVTTNKTAIDSNDVDIQTNKDDIADLDTRVTQNTNDIAAGITTSVTVKDGGGANITLNFTKGILTSVT